MEEKWEYINDQENKYRYILGKRGKNILFCMGINPSDAEPDNLDPTITVVENVMEKKGFDGWIMFNIYPQRATKPKDLDKEIDKDMHQKNIKEITNFLKTTSNPTIWAAWGTSIKKRPYLIKCLKEINENLDGLNVKWFSIGKKCKDGHPHHPLFLSYCSNVQKFDIMEYIQNF